MQIRAITGSGEASSNHVSRPTSEPSKPSKRSQAIWASRASNEAIQLLSQPASQSANQPTNIPTNQKKLTDQPTNQPTKEPISLLTNHGVDLPNYSKSKGYDPPCLAYFIMIMMMRMIQKVALKSLKFGYVQVETPKFLRPCTLACNCKIIWDSEFDKVGGFPRKFQSYPVGEAFSKITLNFNLNKDFPVN